MGSRKGKRYILHDLTGMTFGDLKVVERAENSPGGLTRWKCVCEKCGNERIVFASKLKKGTATMCNECRRKQMVIHGLSYDRIYPVWQAIIRRCENPDNDHYKDYGGRGISVCEEWHDPNKFAQWAYENGFQPDAKRGSCTIERRDVNGDYCPENCYWADMEVQGRNKRDNRIIEHNGERLTLVEWSERCGILASTITRRLSLGWTVEDALFRPPKKKAGNKKAVICKNDGKVYASLIEACVHYGLSYDKVRKVVDTEATIDGYAFCRYDDSACDNQEVTK